jgi:hypothetical protein
MLFPTAGGVVMLTSAANNANDVFLDSMRIENAASPRLRATTTGGVSSSNGFTYDSTGRLLYVDATAGLPANTQYCNGIPFDANGAMCVSTNAVSTYSNGIPFAANGSVAVGITP